MIHQFSEGDRVRRISDGWRGTVLDPYPAGLFWPHAESIKVQWEEGGIPIVAYEWPNHLAKLSILDLMAEACDE